MVSPEEYPVARALLAGRPIEPVELQIRRFDGTEGTVLVSAAPIKDRQGRVTGAVGINLDITERKQAENELLLSEENLAASQAIAHVGSYFWDLEKDLMMWSDELYRILGLAPHEFPPTYDCVHGLHPSR